MIFTRFSSYGTTSRNLNQPLVTKILSQLDSSPIPCNILRRGGHRDVATNSLLFGDLLELPDHLALCQLGLEEAADGLLGNLGRRVEGVGQALGEDVWP